jgi:hypothetical protein
VRAKPGGLGERELRLALAEGWRIDAAAMRYAAVGALDDISSFVHGLRGEHRRTADTEHAWLAPKETVAGVA